MPGVNLKKYLAPLRQADGDIEFPFGELEWLKCSMADAEVSIEKGAAQCWALRG